MRPIGAAHLPGGALADEPLQQVVFGDGSAPPIELELAEQFDAFGGGQRVEAETAYLVSHRAQPCEDGADLLAIR